MTLKKTDKEGLFKNLSIAYLILLFHVVLLAGIAIFVILIKGFFQYLPWIMAGAGLVVILFGWIVFRQMRKNSSHIQDVLSSESLRDRDVEISFMGGLAAFKIQAKENTDRLLEYPGPDRLSAETRLIETEADRAEREINQLTALYEKNLISKEAFEKAKQTIIQG
ncbi:MAG: SHOCT domain-containing protein [Desulfotignum sp.]